MLAAGPAAATIYGQQFDGMVGDPPSVSNNTAFGFAVAAGDVNGDGVDDLIAGDPFASPAGTSGRGAIYILHGAPGVLPSGAPADADAIVLGAVNSEALGSSLAAVDVNGDGYADVIAASVGPNGVGSAVFIFHGSPTGIPSGTTATANTRIDGLASTFLGTDVSDAGDVDSDGYEDIVIGARLREGIGTTSYVYVFHGGPGGIASGPASGADTVLSAADAGGTITIGDSVAGGGDLDRDGYDDIAVGVRDSHISTLIFRGGPSGIPDGTIATAATVLEGSAPDLLGSWWRDSIDLADLDADGDADLVIGSPSNANANGAVHAYEGKTGGIPSGSESGARSVITGQLSGHFGDRVANVGDVNGDGVDDVVGVATSDWGLHFYCAGAAYVVLGGGPQGPASGNVTQVLSRLRAASDYPCDYLGWGGAAGGDFDADGYGDVAIGSPYYYIVPTHPPAGESTRGAVFLARGGPIPLCDDTIDNDGDTYVDYPFDTECASSASNAEIAKCSDGIDNDGDLLIDYPADLQCKSRWQDRESKPPGCGLGAELACASTAFAWLRRRGRTRLA